MFISRSKLPDRVYGMSRSGICDSIYGPSGCDKCLGLDQFVRHL